MSIPYAGNPANFPVDFLIPDSSDPPEAAFENVSKEALGDRTAFLKRLVNGYAAFQEFTATGTWTCPPGVTRVALWGFGGGGGGAAGKGGGSVSANTSGGGGGGAGARASMRVVTVVPGQVYDVVIGAGGAAGNTSALDGGDGGSTTFTKQTGSVLIATMRGGRGGVGAHNLASSSQQYLAPGGTGPASSVAKPNCVVFTADNIPFFGWPEGAGGPGSTRNRTSTLTVLQLQSGAASSEGFVGGAGGADGADDSTNLGGGGGGGGGAGPLANGGSGGIGGAGDSGSSSGFTGLQGSIVAANTGAGGGGGGGGGQGTASFGSFGTGRAGGSGYFVILGLLRDEP